MWPVIIKPGDRIRISGKSGYYSRKSFISRIGDILEQEKYLVYTPISEGSFIRLPLDEEYIFLFYTQNGLLQASGTVYEHCIISDVDYIKIEVFEFQRIQRRLFYRLNSLIDFTFTKVKDLSDEKLKDNLPVYKGVTKDISGGGLRFFFKLCVGFKRAPYF